MENTTARLVDRFITAFRERDPSLIPDLVAESCVKIVEALGYAKTPALDVDTAEVIRRYNDVFQRHDPSALAEIVSADCVIENTSAAPDGERYVGREACVDLWSRIATTPGMRFDIEDVVVAGERATIRWRLIWGDRREDSVRGVNLMRVQGGLITEALGYVKGKS